jgi:hypothetical protein
MIYPLPYRLIFQACAIITSCAWAQADESTWQSIFNGESLDGWHVTAKTPHSKASGNRTGGNWRVENGSIVGSQDSPRNGGLLITDIEYSDIEVVLETNNDFGPDSGLFLRCTEDGKAYQCLIDYHEGGTIGGILGEGIWKRRGVRNFTFGKTPAEILHNENELFPCPILAESWPSFWRDGQWNEVRARITADPPRMQTWVNGVKIMEYVEPASIHPAKGHIGLQVHGGERFGGTVRYRNIRMRPVTDTIR